jgi:ankyrin repeat protein
VIQYGANVNAVANAGTTPVLAAAERNHPEAIRALVKAGADINARMDDGLGVIHRAAQHGLVDILEAAVSQGMPIDALAGSRTPLSIAALHGQTPTVDWLLRHGAAVDVPSSPHQLTPLNDAIDQGHYAIARAHSMIVAFVDLGAALDQALKEIKRSLFGSPHQRCIRRCSDVRMRPR